MSKDRVVIDGVNYIPEEDCEPSILTELEGFKVGDEVTINSHWLPSTRWTGARGHVLEISVDGDGHCLVIDAQIEGGEPTKRLHIKPYNVDHYTPPPVTYKFAVGDIVRSSWYGTDGEYLEIIGQPTKTRWGDHIYIVKRLSTKPNTNQGSFGTVKGTLAYSVAFLHELEIPTFEVGDRVYISDHIEKNAGSVQAGWQGIVRLIQGTGDYKEVGVEFWNEFIYGHDLQGTAKTCHGYWFYSLKQVNDPHSTASQAVLVHKKDNL